MLRESSSTDPRSKTPQLAVKRCSHGLHKAILHCTFVRVRPSHRRTRTKVRVCVRVRRPPTLLDFLYVVDVYDIQKYEVPSFR